jgi:pteridine reductase
MSSQQSKGIAFVTGSGRRLGRQLAYAFAEAGYDVVLHAHRSIDGMREAADAIKTAGREAWTVEGDLSRADEIARIAGEVRDIAPRLDVLVNNAGAFPQTTFENITEADWDTAVDINAKSQFFLTRACAPMLESAGGNVVNIVSAGAFEAWKNHIPYNISKAAAVMVTKALAKALAPGIRVNGVAPGIILVPGEETRDPVPESRIPLQRHGMPADLAEAALFLARTRYITGHILPVDGGLMWGKI